MMATVPRSDMGMARMTLRVLESDPKKSQQTKAVRRTDSSSSNWISLTDSRMNCVLSLVMPRVMSGGSVFMYWSSVSRTFWDTATALAPRCFLMPMPWAGPPSTRAMRRTSSKPSSTRATSLR
jgi:hypothetical protein